MRICLVVAFLVLCKICLHGWWRRQELADSRVRCIIMNSKSAQQGSANYKIGSAQKMSKDSSRSVDREWPSKAHLRWSIYVNVLLIKQPKQFGRVPYLWNIELFQLFNRKQQEVESWPTNDSLGPFSGFRDSDYSLGWHAATYYVPLLAFVSAKATNQGWHTNQYNSMGPAWNYMNKPIIYTTNYISVQFSYSTYSIKWLCLIVRKHTICKQIGVLKSMWLRRAEYFHSRKAQT